MTDGALRLRLYNTLTRSKEEFVPIDPGNVRMYVCGPTVYDFAHIGNARPVIVFDVLYRLLRHVYGADHVTYVRNITDVDDKINARALRDYPGLPLNEAIRKVTEATANQFHADVKALGALPPTHEPRATDFVLPRADGKSDMVSLIQSLLDRGHAYVATGEEGAEILFDTASMHDYGQLSKRPLDEQQAGARIAVDAHKKNPGDFVLWKESSADEPGWEARFSLASGELVIRGRPGWHIECSAMSAAYLGEVFDIHGGGLDLIFPHHENEIAQSRCAHGTDVMANYWMHNGFLQVEGQKMSKSLGNFVTINELLETEKFGGRKWPGEVLRLAMLMTHYREPIDFSVRRLEEAFQDWVAFGRVCREHLAQPEIDPDAVELLANDLATSEVITRLRQLRSDAEGNLAAGRRLTGTLRMLGFFEQAFPVAMSLHVPLPLTDYSGEEVLLSNLGLSGDVYVAAIAAHLHRRHQDNASRVVQELQELPKGLTIADVRGWREQGIKPSTLVALRARRLAFIREKNWAEADRIRDELLAQGIQLKDGKDPATGERVTTWEVRR